jgi:hypothetical protein
MEALSNMGCYGRWERAQVDMARGGERTPTIPRLAFGPCFLQPPADDRIARWERTERELFGPVPHKDSRLAG